MALLVEGYRAERERLLRVEATRDLADGLGLDVTNRQGLEDARVPDPRGIDPGPGRAGTR